MFASNKTSIEFDVVHSNKHINENIMPLRRLSFCTVSFCTFWFSQGKWSNMWNQAVFRQKNNQRLWCLWYIRVYSFQYIYQNLIIRKLCIIWYVLQAFSFEWISNHKYRTQLCYVVDTRIHIKCLNTHFKAMYLSHIINTKSTCRCLRWIVSR